MAISGFYYLLQAIMQMAGRNDCLENRQRAMHCAIVYANTEGTPAGQTLRPVTPPPAPAATSAAKDEVTTEVEKNPKKRVSCAQSHYLIILTGLTLWGLHIL